MHVCVCVCEGGGGGGRRGGRKEGMPLHSHRRNIYSDGMSTLEEHGHQTSLELDSGSTLYIIISCMCAWLDYQKFNFHTF